MEIQYRITAYHQPTGSIMVKFYDDVFPDGVMFSLNLPMVDGKPPQGDALDAFIRNFIPNDMFRKARESSANGENLTPMVKRPDTGLRADVSIRNDIPYFIRDGQMVLVARSLSLSAVLDTPVEIF